MSKFKAGDKVVALKGFHTTKIGDILTVENSGEYWFQAAECQGYSLYVANYELYKPQFRNMKFKVESPEHSKEIQEALFEMGYKWNGHHKQSLLEYTNYSYIYTDEEGIILYGSWEPTFNQDTSDEFTVETTKSYKLIPVEIPKETLTIDGKTYDKEAVLKRLAELEEVK